MIKIKEMADILLNSNDLYNECGELFKYLAEVRINFSSLEAHNVPWQLSQIIEIISSNKLDGNNMQLKDVIFNYCYNTLSYGEKTKKAIIASFKSMFWITKIRNDKEKESINFTDILKIINVYQSTFSISAFKNKHLKEEDMKHLLTLINGKFSNNPLYFFPLFLILCEEMLKDFVYNYSVISTLTNLYLIKNKLLFAPSICFSYPLFNNIKQYKKLLIAIKENPKEIVNFSRFVFDLIKQASVVSRAFISDYSNIKSKLNTLLKEKKIKSSKEQVKLLKNVVFEKFDKPNKETLKDSTLTEFLISEGMLTEIGPYKPVEAKYGSKTIYMFNEYINSIEKLIKNKKEKTTKIFTLKENLN